MPLRRWFHQMSLGCCHSLVRVRHRRPQHLYTHPRIDTPPHSRSVFVMSLGRCPSLVRVRHRELLQLSSRLEWTPYARLMFVSWQKYGDEVRVDTMPYDINAGDVEPPTANPFPTRFTACIPSVPRPPVRSHIYFIAYERAIHPLVFPSFSHRLTVAQNVRLEHSVCLPVTIYGWARLILVSCPNVILSFLGSSSCRSWTPFSP